MKFIKLLALLVCASTLLLAVGCKTCCKNSCCATEPSCDHQCCKEAKTDCAHCPKCNAKK